jgi:IclR family acetate operon transcriptional repressor
MDRKDPVRTAGRTLDVFEAFAEARGPLSLTDLARRVGMPVSSCHALIRTLQARGYVYALDRRKRIYPTKRLLAIAGAVAGNDPLLERLAPVLRRLRDRTGETVLLGKLQDREVRYLDVVEGTQTVRYTASPGEAKPLHSSAIGKCLLGQLDDGALAGLVGRLALPAVTANTITAPDRLLADIAAGRRRGYFVTRGENVADVMAIAAARRVAGETVGIAVAGPLTRMLANEAAHAAALAETIGLVDEIGVRLPAG